jgi:hypothetical protein
MEEWTENSSAVPWDLGTDLSQPYRSGDKCHKNQAGVQVEDAPLWGAEAETEWFSRKLLSLTWAQARSYCLWLHKDTITHFRDKAAPEILELAWLSCLSLSVSVNWLDLHASPDCPVGQNLIKHQHGQGHCGSKKQDQGWKSGSSSRAPA